MKRIVQFTFLLFSLHIIFNVDSPVHAGNTPPALPHAGRILLNTSEESCHFFKDLAAINPDFSLRASYAQCSDPCYLQGVTCNAERDVVEIDLSNQPGISRFPFESQMQNTVKILKINGTHIAYLPHILSPELIELDAGHTDLQEFTIEQSPNLKKLLLPYTKVRAFSGPLPHSIEVIDLSYSLFENDQDTVWPDSMIELRIAGTPLRRMVKNLPASLRIFDQGGKNLSTLDPGLPEELETLILDGSMVSTTTNIPHHLKRLSMRNTRLRIWGELPQTLEFFDVSGCDIVKDQPLPPQLKIFYANNTPARKLTLPASVEIFSGTHSALEELVIQGNLVRVINIEWSHVTSFKQLPRALEEFLASHSDLEQLPESLPVGTKQFLVGYTRLQKLPILPDALERIDISNNIRLTEFPEVWPSQTTTADISWTGIEKVPELPSGMKIFRADGCKTSVLKIALKEGLEEFSADHTKGWDVTSTVSRIPSSLRKLSLRGVTASLPADFRATHGNLTQFLR